MGKKKSGTTRSAMTWRMSPQLFKDVTEAAKVYGLSRNQFVTNAVETAVWASQRASTVAFDPNDPTRLAPEPQPQADTPVKAPSRSQMRRETVVNLGDIPLEQARTAGEAAAMIREAQASVALDQGAIGTRHLPHDVHGEPVERPDQNRMEELTTKSGHVLTDEEIEGFAAEDELGDPEFVANTTEEEIWGEKHVHKCDTLVDGSEYWERGQRWAQFSCRCGKTVAKRHTKKAM